MSETLFVSDLHLDPQSPAPIRLFERLLNEARGADALYILGDLFEAWIGDDDPAPGFEDMIAALRRLGAAGTPVYFIHGNRDFLLGQRFAARSGIRLLPESTVVDLYGTPTLIMHGDTLCTDDHRYLAFRKKARNPLYQRVFFLWKSLEKRKAIAQRLREKSREEVQQKTAEIMDVNPDAVARAMQRHGVRQLIHGHTHRPAIHEFTIGANPATRIVLGDWYERGSVLRVQPDSYRLDSYS